MILDLSKIKELINFWKKNVSKVILLTQSAFLPEVDHVSTRLALKSSKSKSKIAKPNSIEITAKNPKDQVLNR